MRAKINHGNRGTKIDTLVKRYEFEYPYQYYDYIYESYMLGHYDQAVELFNAMKGEQQKSFLLNAALQYGSNICNFIINRL